MANWEITIILVWFSNPNLEHKRNGDEPYSGDRGPVSPEKEGGGPLGQASSQSRPLASQLGSPKHKDHKVPVGLKERRSELLLDHK